MSNVSLAHEAPLDVLREEPRAVFELLRLAGSPVSEEDALTVELQDSELTEALPSVRQADLVVLLRDKAGRARQTLIVEVQRDRDDEKVLAWPIYIAYLEARYRVPTTLMVLTFDNSVAAWARKNRAVGTNMAFAPFVLGPNDLPAITSVDDALKNLDRGVLIALARLGARDPGRLARHQAEVILVFEALLRSEPTRARQNYLWLLHGTASGTLRAMLDRLLEEHDMTALEMIFNDGKAEGKVEGEAAALIKVLRARGIHVDSAVEERIRNTRDVTLIDRWLERALTGTTADEVLAD